MNKDVAQQYARSIWIPIYSYELNLITNLFTYVTQFYVRLLSKNKISRETFSKNDLNESGLGSLTFFQTKHLVFMQILKI